MRQTSLAAINMLSRSLTYSSLRGSALGQNLANVNTPGYKRLDVDFQSALQSAITQGQSQPGVKLATTAAGHRAGFGGATGASAGAAGGLSAGEIEVVRAGGTTLRNDGNNVDVEAEMAMLAENSLFYQALVQQMNNHLGLLRLAITEGRR